MNIRRMFLLAAALSAVCSVSLADTVKLKTGETVEGKIEKVDADKLFLRTSKGMEVHTRDKVAAFYVLQTGPNGKPVLREMKFKPEPVKMPFQIETEHYVIKTDCGEQVCRNAGQAMEQLYSAYKILFKPSTPTRDKTDVVIWDDQQKFREYAEGLGVKLQSGTLGFFRQDSDGSQIMVYRRRSEDFSTMNTLYHEATHQFIMMTLGPGKQPPLWVNEGLAVYFESSRWENGRLQTGIIPRQRLIALQTALKAGKHVPIADLLKRDKDTFDALCYSESWALVYFFAKANNGAYSDRFSAYFRALKEGKDADDSFKKCFTPDLDKLEEAWKKFVLELKVPKK